MEQEEVHIHGISYNAMCKILNFIYTSELELSVNSVQETLAAACQLQVRYWEMWQKRSKKKKQQWMKETEDMDIWLDGGLGGE